MRCRWCREKRKKRWKREQEDSRRGLEKDSEKRRVTTLMKKKIERMERRADLSKRQFRNYEKGTGLCGAICWPERDHIAFLFFGCRADAAPRRLRAWGHNPFSIRIEEQAPCIYFARLPPFSCYFKYHRSWVGNRPIADHATRFGSLEARIMMNDGRHGESCNCLFCMLLCIKSRLVN